jgi:hypothetical protein
MPYEFHDDLRTRVRQAVERRLRRVSYFEDFLQLGHRLARANHVEKLPWLDGPLRGIYQQLSETGLAQLPLDALGVPTGETLRAAEAHVERLRRLPSVPGRTYELTSNEELLAQAEPFVFGLSRPLLDLAERYLGLPVDYLGVNIKREFANGLSEGTRLWHADPEDERMLKIIVYLSDVDAGSGPFAAVDARQSAEAKKRLRYAWGSTCTPEALEKVVPPTEWRTFVGPRLTAVFCDTARCLHRASPPTTVDRYSMTFSYLSRKAYFCFASGRTLQRAFVERWGARLDPHQLSCLVPA